MLQLANDQIVEYLSCQNDTSLYSFYKNNNVESFSIVIPNSSKVVVHKCMSVSMSMPEKAFF